MGQKIIKKRRAVGGLISLIGLIVVFGVVSVAYLQLTSSQTEVSKTSFAISQKISDRNMERLNFTSISNNSTHYFLEVENLGSKTAILNSFLIQNSTSISGKGELGIKLFAAEKTITPIFLVSSLPNPSDDKIILITDLGKKCVIPGDGGFRLC